MPNEIIFLVNACCSLFMTGLIWYVQLVHYPSFKFVSTSNFGDFHNFHSLRTGFIVMPVMCTELITSGILTWQTSFISLQAIGFYLVLLNWLSTFTLSVPTHAKLSNGKDDKLIRHLVLTNWPRTVLWTVKSALAISLILD